MTKKDKPIKPLKDRSKEEDKKIRSEAGKKSHETRQKNRDAVNRDIR